MRLFLSASILVLFISLVSFLVACRHDPVLPGGEGPDPVDTTPIDTTPVDTTPVDTTPVDTTMPCDPDKVYFETQVLPLLRGNCAISGCHDAASHQKDVILDSYDNVMATADVEPFNLDGSKLFKVLIETDPNKRMPRPPQPPVPFDQVNLIAKWILEGAQNLTCDDSIPPGGCDTTSVSYAQFVRPTLQTNCQGCHSGSAPSGGINLTTHAGVKSAAVSGRLYGAIARLPGFKPMPFNGNKLHDCNIDKIKAWIDAGAPNN